MQIWNRLCGADCYRPLFSQAELSYEVHSRYLEIVPSTTTAVTDYSSIASDAILKLQLNNSVGYTKSIANGAQSLPEHIARDRDTMFALFDFSYQARGFRSDQ